MNKKIILKQGFDAMIHAAENGLPLDMSNVNKKKILNILNISLKL